MKELPKKNKIIICTAIVFILIGIIILCTVGFHKSLAYTAGTRIEVFIPQGYDKQEIVTIAEESFSSRPFEFQKIEKLGQVAGILLKEYTAEELDAFKSKVAEKYAIEKDSLQIEEVAIPSIRISTDIKPYKMSIGILTVLTAIYVLFRNWNAEKKWKIVIKSIVTIFVVLGLYFTLYLIVRIPYGTYTMPIAFAIYFLAIMYVSTTKEGK